MIKKKESKRMRRRVCSIKVMAIVLVSMLVRTSVSWAVDEHVLSGRERIGGIVAQGDRHVVHSESVVKQTTVRGIQEIHALGTAVRTLILAGGQQDVSGNGRAIGTTIKPQGEQHFWLYLNTSFTIGTTIKPQGEQHLNTAEERGKEIGTTIKPQGEQHVRGNSRAEDTIIQAGGRQRVFRDGKAKRTTIRLGGKMTADSGSTISGIDNSGLVKVRATDPVMNTIKNYTGHSGSVLKVDTLDTAHYPDHPTANYPAVTLEGRTVLGAGAEVKLSGRTGKLTMRGNVHSNGGVIKIDVASNLLSGGLVIIDGMVEGLVKIAITLSGAVMDIDEPTTVDDFLRPIYPLYPMIIGVRSGSGFGMGRPVGEDEQQDTDVVRRRQIVRFAAGADTARASFDFSSLPSDYNVDREDDGYYLCFKNLKK